MRVVSKELVRPLAEKLHADAPRWKIEAVLAEDASKWRLSQVIGANNPPSLLFTATHCMEFSNGHGKQLSAQGALLCADWPGPESWHEPLPPEFYFTGEDVGGLAGPKGMIAFFLSGYSCGTSGWDELHRNPNESTRTRKAPRAFVARLPQNLLAHSDGGALAVIGRVDMAFTTSFIDGGKVRNVGVFSDAIRRLIEGAPVGFAMAFFSDRYTELAAEYAGILQELEAGTSSPRDSELSLLKTALNDAKNYVVIGDPAVRVTNTA